MRKLKPDPYLVNQIEHLINIILQRAPGFKLATDQSAAPIASIQSAFTDIYEIKHHIPSIMHLASLDSLATDSHPIYYSLAHPTMLDGSPLSGRSTTRKTNLKHIIYILNLLKNFIADGADNRLKTVKLRYFHTEGDPANQIDSSRVIPEYDVRFLTELHQWPDRQFCNTSHFWRGCIGFKPLNSTTRF